MDSTTAYLQGTERTHDIPKGADSTHGIPYRHGEDTIQFPYSSLSAVLQNRIDGKRSLDTAETFVTSREVD
jgi:hypothetical protein